MKNAVVRIGEMISVRTILLVMGVIVCSSESHAQSNCTNLLPDQQAVCRCFGEQDGHLWGLSLYAANMQASETACTTPQARDAYFGAALLNAASAIEGVYTALATGSGGNLPNVTVGALPNDNAAFIFTYMKNQYGGAVNATPADIRKNLINGAGSEIKHAYHYLSNVKQQTTSPYGGSTLCGSPFGFRMPFEGSTLLNQNIDCPGHPGLVHWLDQRNTQTQNNGCP